MRIEKDCLVKMHYSLTDKDGLQLDSTLGGEPFEYIHGNGMLIPGLEVMLEGKDSGLKFRAVVEPKEAYGEYDSKMIVKLPLEQFDSDKEISVGMIFQAENDEGNHFRVKVIEIDENFVTVDANHELAGKQLTFDIEIIDVRMATEEDFNAINHSCHCSGGSCSCECGGEQENGGCSGGGCSGSTCGCH